MRYVYGKRVRKFRDRLSTIVASFIILANGMGSTLPFLFAQNVGAAPHGSVIVRPSSLNGWDSTNASGGTNAFVDDATAPYGNGALEFRTTAANASRARREKSVSPNISISDLSSLSYSTKYVSGPAHAGASLQITINGLTGVSSSSSTTLVYEPYWNGTVDTSGSWQTWDTMASGKFWSTNTIAGFTNGSGGAPFYTISEVLAAHQNAKITSIKLNIGTSNPSWVVRADGVNLNGTIYDFEPNVTPVVNGENFNTVNDPYRGISVGFNTKDFGNVTAVEVEIERAAGGSVKKTANADVINAISNNPNQTQHTAPFVIADGSFSEASDLDNWNSTTPSPALWNATTIPTKAIIRITDQHGTKTAQITNFSQGGSSWPTYNSLLPYVFPSTNDNNKTSNRPHVNLLSTSVGELGLEFINETNSQAFFEYRIDGVSAGTTSHPVVTGSTIHPGVSVDNRSTASPKVSRKTQVFTASSKVEVRLALGGERDWDFDWVTFNVVPHPDPENKHQMSVGGHVYRDHTLNDCFNLSSCNNRAEKLGAGWTINLYKEVSNNQWEFIKSTETNSSGDFSFSAVKDAGTYHVCEVVKSGWTQQVQNWNGTPYHMATSNLSGNAAEGPYCRTITYADTGNYSNVFYFGNVDSKKPFTEVLSPDEHGVYGQTSISVNIRSTDNESGITKAVANIHKVGQTPSIVKPCVNQTVSPATLEHNFECVIDTTDLEDGEYYIKTNAQDAGSNLSNTVSWYFVIDKTAPDTPTHISPGNDSHQNYNDFYFDWTNADGAVEYEFQSSQSNSTDSNGALNSGVWNNKAHGGSDRNYLTDSQIHSYGANGTWYWQVRAIDAVGNKSAWTSPWKMTIDMSTPDVPSASLTADNDGDNVPNGGTTDSQYFTFSLVSSSDTVRYQLKYWNDIDGSSFKESSPWNPTNLSGYSPTLGVYKDNFTKGEGRHYFAFSACDAAGNCSAYSEPFVVDYSLPGNNEETPPVDEETEPEEEGPEETPGENSNNSSGGGIVVTNAGAAGQTLGITTPPEQSISLMSITRGSLLADDTSDVEEESTGSVLQARDTNANTQTNEQEATEEKSCTKWLGICWYYWIPVAIVIILVTYYVVRDRSSKD